MSHIEKREILSKKRIIEFQLITYCFLNRIEVTAGELSCLTLLGEKKEAYLNAFCIEVYQNKIYSSIQGARNVLRALELKGLVLKEGRGNKTITLNPSIQLDTDECIVLDYKFEHVKTNKIPGVDSVNS